MTYYGAKELAASFRTVRKNTVTIAEEIPEQQYSFRAAPDTRTVAQMLTHIAVIPRLQEQVHGVERRTTLDGFDFPTFFGKLIAEEQTPRAEHQLLARLRDEGERLASWLDSLPHYFVVPSIAIP